MNSRKEFFKLPLFPISDNVKHLNFGHPIPENAVLPFYVQGLFS